VRIREAKPRCGGVCQIAGFAIAGGPAETFDGAGCAAKVVEAGRAEIRFITFFDSGKKKKTMHLSDGGRSTGNAAGKRADDASSGDLPR
jgi:hypothetical protein